MHTLFRTVKGPHREPDYRIKGTQLEFLEKLHGHMPKVTDLLISKRTDQ